MRLRVCLFLALCLPFVAAPPLRAQSPDLMAAYRQYQKLYAAGRFDEAESFAKRALTHGEAEFGTEHPSFAVLLNNLATLYRAQGQLAEAEPLFRRALAIKEKTLPPDDPSVAATLNNLAALLRDQGRLAEAEPLYRRSLALIDPDKGGDITLQAKSLSNLAELLLASNRAAKAEPLIRKALELTETAYGNEHPQYATRLSVFGSFYRQTGKPEKAIALQKQALEIERKVYGEVHLKVAATLHNLAAAQIDTDDLSAAEESLLLSLGIHQEVLGLDSPQVASKGTARGTARPGFPTGETPYWCIGVFSFGGSGGHPPDAASSSWLGSLDHPY